MFTGEGVVFTLDLKGNYTWICQNIVDVSGYTQEEVIGTHCSRYIHPDDFVAVAKRLENPPVGITIRDAFRVIDKSGESVPVECKTLVTNDAILGIFYPVNENKIYPDGVNK